MKQQRFHAMSTLALKSRKKRTERRRTKNNSKKVLGYIFADRDGYEDHGVC